MIIYLIVLMKGDEAFVNEFDIAAFISVLVLTIGLSLYQLYHFKNYYENYNSRYVRFYFLLLLSLIFYVIAESLYGTLEHLNYDQYPSIADIFYMSYFAAAAMACFVIFKDNLCILKTQYKAISISVGVAFILLYCVMCYPFDSENFVIGLVMISLSSTVAVFALLASFTVYSNATLRFVIIIICMAFLANSIADAFYYTDENYDQYSSLLWYNAIWFGTLLMISYGIMYHAIVREEQNASTCEPKKDKE